MSKAIESFTGPYRFLSNFWEAPVRYLDVVWPSNEHAFQAMKTLDKGERSMVWAAKTPGMAKRMGRNVTRRDDWDAIKVSVMYAINKAKYEQHPDLARKLKATKDAVLIEGNNWGDRFWGVDGDGQNHLGLILMKVRSELV